MLDHRLARRLERLDESARFYEQLQSGIVIRSVKGVSDGLDGGDGGRDSLCIVWRHSYFRCTLRRGVLNLAIRRILRSLTTGTVGCSVGMSVGCSVACPIGSTVRRHDFGREQ